MRAILAALALALLSASTAHTSGGCSPVRTTSDGYVCSRTAYVHYLEYQAKG